MNLTYLKNVKMMAEDTDDQGESGVAVIEKTKTKKPKMYQVLIHNDDFTTMEFVVFILERIFKKSKPQATAIMLAVHTKGRGVCGVYTHEIAETKASKVSSLAKKEGHPLKCSIEPED